MIGSDEVIVLGTRRTDRTVIESTVSIDIITPAEIAATGFVETTQILQMLVPSYNAPQASITDGSDHVRPYSGFSPFGYFGRYVYARMGLQM